jgi:hypothetical protein
LPNPLDATALFLPSEKLGASTNDPEFSIPLSLGEHKTNSSAMLLFLSLRKYNCILCTLLPTKFVIISDIKK